MRGCITPAYLSTQGGNFTYSSVKLLKGLALQLLPSLFIIVWPIRWPLRLNQWDGAYPSCISTRLGGSCIYSINSPIGFVMTPYQQGYCRYARQRRKEM